MDENNNSGISLAEKVRGREKVILYELVPAPVNKEQADIEESVSLIVTLLSKLHVDGINIPEVREEKRNGDGNAKYIEKLALRDLISYLYSAGFNDVIINRPIIYNSWEDQKKWLEETYNTKSIRNFVFVGGESSSVSYPGIGVGDAAKEVTQICHEEFPDIFLGGITIPTRNNEAERLLKKSQAGIEFFTTQILYEADSIKRLLKDYWDLCLEKKVQARMICLSFAPVTSKKDIELLSWLGVKIPEATIEFLEKGWLGMGWRSLEICRDILDDVFQFVKTRGIQVPIGINIGYINRHNFEFSIVFLEHLGDFYLQKQKQTEIKERSKDLSLQVCVI